MSTPAGHRTGCKLNHFLVGFTFQICVFIISSRRSTENDSSTILLISLSVFFIVLLSFIDDTINLFIRKIVQKSKNQSKLSPTEKIISSRSSFFTEELSEKAREAAVPEGI